MDEAVGLAKQVTPAGGVVLLSPAAPSYGYYRDFAERGRDFAAKAGLGRERAETTAMSVASAPAAAPRS